MIWCARKSMTHRPVSIASIAAIAAIALTAAGAVHAVDAGTEPMQTAPAAGPGLDPSAGDTAAPYSAKPALRTPAHARAGGTLQHRVDVLSKALQLDARQRTELVAILESQRQAVAKIWSDPAMLPAERTPATRALQLRTADQIRAILSDEQKKHYNPPKSQGTQSPSPNVEDWMRKQQAQAPPQQ
jgi:hypothetical protein